MTTPRSPRRKQDVLKDFRTSEILEAARRVIGEVGFGEASVERIALEARVAKGTLYLYFEGKESLLAHAVREGHKELMARARAPARRGQTSDEKLRGFVGALVGYAAEHQAFCQALLERPDLSKLHGPVEETLRANFDELVRFVETLLARGMRAGEFRAVEPRRASHFLFELLRATLRERFSEGKPPDPGSDVEIIVDFYLHGLAAGEPR
jgi:TetR/AcrR family fatty acid metabolism transcriptional regulator